jgi:hypothetical protein
VPLTESSALRTRLETYPPDRARIREELGYREVVAQAEAIRRTIEWERANPTTSSPHGFDYEAEDLAPTNMNLVIG